MSTAATTTPTRSKALLPSSEDDPVAQPGLGVAARLPFTMLSFCVAVVAALVVGWAATVSWAAALVFAVAVAALAAALAWPLAGVAILAALPALSGLARGLVIPGLRLSEAVAVGVGGTLALLYPRHRAPRLVALDIAAVVYLGLSVLIPAGHLAVGGQPGALFSLLGPVQFLVLYAAAAILGSSAAVRRVVMRTLIVSALPVNVIGLLQYYNVGSTRSILTAMTAADANETSGYDVIDRVTSIFPHWHVLAGFNLVVLLLVLALILVGDRGVLPLPWLAATGLAVLTGMVVTVTATTALGLLLGAVIVAALGRDLPKLAMWGLPALVAISLAFWPLISGRIAEQGLTTQGASGAVPQTLAFRLDIWTEQYLPAIAAQPLTGYGPVLPDKVDFPFSESVYFSLLLRGGIVLMLAYAAVVLLALVTTWRTAADRSLAATDRALGRALTAVLIVLVPMQTLFPYMLTSGLPHAVWLLLGLVRAVRWSGVDR